MQGFQKCAFQYPGFQTDSCIPIITPEKWGVDRQIGVIAEPDWVHEKIYLNFNITKKFELEKRVSLVLNRNYNSTTIFNAIPYKNITISNRYELELYRKYNNLIRLNADLIRKYKISKGFNIEIEDIVAEYFILMSILEGKI